MKSIVVIEDEPLISELVRILLEGGIPGDHVYRCHTLLAKIA